MDAASTSRIFAFTGDGSGQTIAIVDAYHDPYAFRDLQAFDRQFGLADPVFTQAYFGTKTNDGWAGETMLDVEWAHAIAPKAKILLVEAASNSYQDLFTAVNWARNQPGVSVVSMSFGGQEFSGMTYYDQYLTTPSGHNGVTFVASAGDAGAQANYPAISSRVVSVGGTRLNVDGSGNYSGETVWSGTGGGYSSYVKEPSYQTSVQSSGRRSGPDVAYDADPGTGFYVYQTTPSSGRSGWVVTGGTSAGAPQWAGIIAIADQIRVAAGAHTLDGPSQTLYALYTASSSDYHDITSGSNGYGARSGYDLATGRGTPYADRVILDLARFSDSYHGSVMTASALSAPVGNMTAHSFAVSSEVDMSDAATTTAGPTVAIVTTRRSNSTTLSEPTTVALKTATPETPSVRSETKSSRGVSTFLRSAVRPTTAALDEVFAEFGMS